MTFERPDYAERLANMTERCADLKDMVDARAWLGAIADTTEGLGADPPPPGEASNLWFDVVCPEHTVFASNRLYQNMRDWEIKSSCALVVRSHLRRLGLRAVEIGLDASGQRHPYMDQTAIQNVYAVGGTKNPFQPGKAWVVAGVSPPPVGVVCLIGEGNREHVFVTRKVGIVSEGIDGGQIVGEIPNTSPPQLYQGILRKSRPVTLQGRRLFIGDRPLIGWLDPNLLELAAPPTYDLV